jgi:hypothetical protein
MGRPALSLRILLPFLFNQRTLFDRKSEHHLNATHQPAQGFGGKTALWLRAGQWTRVGSGTLSGSGGGSGSGAGAGSLGPVTGSGSADGSGSGGFQVTRRKPVLAPGGERIGKVRERITNGRGEVQQMLVKVGDSTALVPATNFSASGNGVMSAMTASQIQQTVAQQ